jgi:hypothetical protein
LNATQATRTSAVGKSKVLPAKAVAHAA